jgi:hypothetical protein
MRARHEWFATHEHHTAHEDLDPATSNVRVHAARSGAVTLTVRVFEE